MLDEKGTAAFVIREATERDAPEVARLLSALDHPTTPTDVSERWARWATEGNVALAAVLGHGGFAGIVTLHRMTVLHRPPPVGRITALIVDAPMRGKGVGRALVRAAEETLSKAGCGLLEITSAVKWAGAHAFYSHLGYQQTSLRFAKVLSPPVAR